MTFLMEKPGKIHELTFKWPKNSNNHPAEKYANSSKYWNLKLILVYFPTPLSYVRLFAANVYYTAWIHEYIATCRQTD